MNCQCNATFEGNPDIVGPGVRPTLDEGWRACGFPNADLPL